MLTSIDEHLPDAIHFVCAGHYPVESQTHELLGRQAGTRVLGFGVTRAAWSSVSLRCLMTRRLVSLCREYGLLRRPACVTSAPHLNSLQLISHKLHERRVITCALQALIRIK